MTPGRIVVGIVSIAGLITVFLFQQFDVAGLIGVHEKASRFFINRTIRRRFYKQDYFKRTKREPVYG